MNSTQTESSNPHAAPQRPRAFTITTLSRIARGGITRCAPVPYLRMAGQWLEQYWFRSGCRVIVTGENGRLVRTLAGRARCEIDVDVTPPHSYDGGTGACDAPSN